MKRTAELVLFPEQDAIDSMEPLLSKFLERLFDFRPGQCFVTDLSSLNDFVPRGMPEGSAPSDASYGQILDAWDSWALAEVERLFGVRPAKTSDTLLVILAAIQRHRARRLQ